MVQELTYSAARSIARPVAPLSLGFFVLGLRGYFCRQAALGTRGERMDNVTLIRVIAGVLAVVVVVILGFRMKKKAPR